MDIAKYHEELLSFLLEYRENVNSKINFQLRKTNRDNKLKDGYWFPGTDQYLYISFWKGFSGQSKRPVFAFYCDKFGQCKFEINTWTNESLTSLLNDILPNIPILDIDKYDGVLKLEFSSFPSPADALGEFLNKYWTFIDRIISEVTFQNSLGNNVFNFINEYEFNENLRIINNYREEINRQDRQLERLSAVKITDFSLKNYGPIKHVQIVNIPFNNQWIFLTGENGVGKSSILKGLGLMIGHKSMSEKELFQNTDFKATIKIQSMDGENSFFERNENVGNRLRKPYTIGFAAYGPMRLQSISNTMSQTKIKKSKSKSGRFDSLFGKDGFLLSIESEMNNWSSNTNINLKRRLSSISELFSEIMLNLEYVEFEQGQDGKIRTKFKEMDLNGEPLESVGFDELSSGYQSIIAMISDMLVRLFHQQPEANDSGDLKGVVIIDEIDIHLHPKFQRHLVEQLTLAFPNVQFIASTHSPIPLLGAPKESIFIKVFRTKENGVECLRLEDKIHIEDLLPNAILTSPIFGLDDITHIQNELDRPIRTEDNYQEVEFNLEVEKRLQKSLTFEREQKLIELFKKRNAR